VVAKKLSLLDSDSSSDCDHELWDTSVRGEGDQRRRQEVAEMEDVED
jgi:hypothetical protein